MFICSFTFQQVFLTAYYVANMTENASADEEFVVDEMADNKQANKKNTETYFTIKVLQR